MRKIIVTEFMSLDGVIDSPHLWSFPYWNDEIAAFKNSETFEAEAMLLGRKTYEGFAAAWPARKGENPFSDRFNQMPKYVVTTTLQTLEWENSHLIRENIVESLKALKDREGGDILVHGSGQLVQTLIQHDLIDQYSLLVYPIVLGKGRRMFDEGTTANLKLTESKQTSTGVMLLKYAPAREG